MAPPSSAQAQVLAKTLTFILLVGLAFILGQGSFTGSTVGDFGSTNKWLGITILAACALGGGMLYLKYRKETRD